jgi:hypothetical protein
MSLLSSHRDQRSTIDDEDVRYVIRRSILSKAYTLLHFLGPNRPEQSHWSMAGLPVSIPISESTGSVKAAAHNT